MLLPSYIVKSRHGIYYFRIRRNGKSICRSLRTRDPKIAVKKSSEIRARMAVMARPDPTDLASLLASLGNEGGAREWKIKISHADATVEIETDGSESDHRLAREALTDVLASCQIQGSVPSAAARHPCTIENAVTDYLQERRPDWSHSTFVDYQSTLRRLIKGLGGTTHLHTLTKDSFVAWRNENLDELHPKSQEKMLGCIAGFEQWAMERGRMVDSFVVRPKLSKATRSRLNAERGEPRQPLNAADLNMIFEPSRLHAARRPDLLWLPLLGLFTGARLGELAQIRVQDIKVDADTLLLHITGAAGHLKTSVSERLIPLHPALKDAGLVTYLQDVERAWPDAERLFPYLVSDPRNGYANRPGKDFSANWSSMLEDGKSFHSLRHTFISALAASRVDQDLARSYTGHTTGRDDVHDRVYNHCLPRIEDYREMLAKLDFTRWPGWSQPDWHYTEGQYDEFFGKAKRDLVVREARSARALRQQKK